MLGIGIQLYVGNNVPTKKNGIYTILCNKNLLSIVPHTEQETIRCTTKMWHECDTHQDRSANKVPSECKE